MSSTPVMFFETIAPLVVFPAMSAIAHTALKPNIDLVEPLYRAQCKPGSRNYVRLSGNGVVDESVCVLISLFHAALEEKQTTAPFNIYFISTLIPVFMLFIFFESSRKRRPFVVSYAGLVVGCAAQIITFAVAIPLFWLYFILAGRYNKAKFSEAHAEASIIGMICGWVIPSVLLVIKEDPVFTLLFQPAAFYAFASQFAYLLVRPKTVLSGSSTAHAAYAASFTVAAAVHIKMAVEHFSNYEGFENFFLPSLSVTDAPRAILNIFQWDFIFASVGCMVGSLWFARSVLEVMGIMMWYASTILFVGPAAAFAAVALWRQNHI